MLKKGHLWPIGWKGKSRLMKQLFCLSPWIIFDFKIKFSGKKLSGKTHSYYCIYVWFKNKRVQTSLDGKNRNLTKKIFYEKILEFFSKTFCLFDLYCQANFWTQNLKQRPIKKKATAEGRPRPLIFHQNLPKILKVTSPFLGKAVYS